MDEITLQARVRDSIATKERMLDACLDDVAALGRLAVDCLRGGNKLMLCGNGGSSCDAAHVAAELVGWFEDKQRDGIAAIALGQETPTLTAIGNDSGFEQVFARQLRALGRPGDLLIGISTSGGSKNVVAAMEAAKALGIRRAALASQRGGRVVELAEVAVKIPSTSTPRIQEGHLLVVHLLCEWIELALAR
ncbi:MAG: SIS domain-containing protein [Planctomycetota bacterium]